MRLRRAHLLPRPGANRRPRITPEERRILWEEARTSLNGINDLERAVDREDWRDADRRAREFAPLLVLCEDIGWERETEEDITLSSPPELLRRAFLRLREVARYLSSHHQAEIDEVSGELSEARMLERTCDRVLGELAVAGSAPGAGQ